MDSGGYTGSVKRGASPALVGIASLLRVRAIWSHALLRFTMNARKLIAWLPGRIGPESLGIRSPRRRIRFGNGTTSGAKIAMANTIGRHIRIDEDHWRRIEALAEAHNTSPNRLLVELAVEALDHREWPRTEFEIQLLRSAMFAAQALARTMIADGRDDEVEQIRRSISAVVPDPPGEMPRSSPVATEHTPLIADSDQ